MSNVLEGPIVVFGATGFLGAAVVREMLRAARDAQRGHGKSSGPLSTRIVCPVRGSNLGPGLGPLAPFVEVVRIGEVTPDTLNDLYYNTLRGDVKAFVHVAGLVRHSSDAATVREMHCANVGLCDTIFAFAERHHIRTVYASASGVVGCQFIEDKFRIAHDDAPLCADAIKGLPYFEQKAAIERKWRPRAAEGRCPIVFLRPSLLLGPGDDRLSSSKVVLDFIQGRMTFLPKGGISFMDVRDAARAFVTALVCEESVVGGTVMNLTAANIPFHEFAAVLEEASGVMAPKLEVPAAVAKAGGRIANGYNTLLGRARDDGDDAVYVETMGNRFWNVTCQRALQLLEFDPRDPSATLRDAARYLHQTYGEARYTHAPAAGTSGAGLSANVGGASSAAALEKRAGAGASAARPSSAPTGGAAPPQRVGAFFRGRMGRGRLIALAALLLLTVYGLLLATAGSAVAAVS